MSVRTDESRRESGGGPPEQPHPSGVAVATQRPLALASLCPRWESLCRAAQSRRARPEEAGPEGLCSSLSRAAFGEARLSSTSSARATISNSSSRAWPNLLRVRAGPTARARAGVRV